MNEENFAYLFLVGILLFATYVLGSTISRVVAEIESSSQLMHTMESSETPQTSD